MLRMMKSMHADSVYIVSLVIFKLADIFKIRINFSEYKIISFISEVIFTFITSWMQINASVTNSQKRI